MNEKKIYDYFRREGYTHNGALALLGNFIAESGGNPIAAENRNYSTYCYNPYDAVGYGIAQWTLGIRKKNLIDYLGDKYCTLEGQLEFTRHELTNEGEYAFLNSQLKNPNATLMELTELVCKVYERPKINNVMARYQFAITANIENEEVKDTEINEMTMLHKGSKGYEVKVLQSLLWMHGYQLEVDGDFGNQTQAAVQSFQTRNNLDADGWVGEKTWTKILKG